MTEEGTIEECRRIETRVYQNMWGRNRKRTMQLTVLPFLALLTSQLVCEFTMLPETSMTDFPFNNREEEGESVSPPAQLSEMCTMMPPTCL